MFMYIGCLDQPSRLVVTVCSVNAHTHMHDILINFQFAVPTLFFAHFVLQAYRNVFLEMLITSVWLYNSFPDVTLWVWYGDEPGACSLHIPIFAYTAIDPAALTNGLNGSATMPFFMPHLLTGAPDAAVSQQRGYVIPYPHRWDPRSAAA